MPYTNKGIGYQSRDTSRAAAKSELVNRVPTLRARAMDMLFVYALAGLTCDELAEKMDESPFAVRPRITELATAGRVEDRGQRRELNSGKKGIVWFPKSAGG